ncbi:ATPase AAA [Candidatus Magnetomorum sp. HK-1]|nr:ATPase AAA [Candidatus Magnetomorum sp. HK-1]
MIKIDTIQLLDILKKTPSEQNIMLVGAHGIGKSQILKSYYENEKKMPLISFFLGQMSDPGDLIGLMHKNEKTGHSEFMPPYWWPDDFKPVVLFLDELNRARPEILQSVMDLTLNRTLAGKTLPKGSIIVSAINYGDEYQITDLDPSLVSRFNIYEFAPTTEDWIVWANRENIDNRVIHFIQKYPHFLDGTNEFSRSDEIPELEKTPDRRAWERVSNLIKNVDSIDDRYVTIMAGIVGVSASVNFKKSIQEIGKLSPEKVLFKFSIKLFKGLKLQDYILLNENIFLFLNKDTYDNKKKKILIRNLVKYIKHLKKSNFQEAIAHLASQLENPNFEKILTLFFIDSEELMLEVSDYIQNIDL